MITVLSPIGVHTEGLAERDGLAATQYGANGASDARNAAACRVKES